MAPRVWASVRNRRTSGVVAVVSTHTTNPSTCVLPVGSVPPLAAEATIGTNTLTGRESTSVDVHKSP